MKMFGIAAVLACAAASLQATDDSRPAPTNVRGRKAPGWRPWIGGQSRGHGRRACGSGCRWSESDREQLTPRTHWGPPKGCGCFSPGRLAYVPVRPGLIRTGNRALGPAAHQAGFGESVAQAR